MTSGHSDPVPADAGPVPGVLAGICVVDPGFVVDRVHGDALS
jgi:UPF0716 family protein affecting phage T7 exclusion